MSDKEDQNELIPIRSEEESVNRAYYIIARKFNSFFKS